MGEQKILVADIGGTNLRLAIFIKDGEGIRIEKKVILRSQDTDSLTSVVKQFLVGVTNIQQGVFAVAGPVQDGEARVTNLPLRIDVGELKRELKINELILLNDLEAVGYFVSHISVNDYVVINIGNPISKTPIVIIAPGTGLGEGLLVWREGGYAPVASEGGHTNFAPTNQLQVSLLSYLLERHPYVNVEMVCSGRGIQNIYEFLRDTRRYDEPIWIKEKIDRGEDITPLIFEAVEGEQECDICIAAVDLFVDIMAGEASNFAVKVIAQGGIYLAGGIPPRIISKIEERFMSAYSQKGNMSELVKSMPVRLIVHPEPGLWGGAYFGFDQMNDVPKSNFR